MTIPATVIQRIAASGFDVYRRKSEDDFVYFTDGARIGYLENTRLSGLRLTSVHIPNLQTGTGFMIAEFIAPNQIDRDLLSQAFVLIPDHSADANASRRAKWRSWDEFHNANPWNRGYQLVAKGIPV